MKKIIFFPLICISILLLASCTGKKNEASSSQVPDTLGLAEFQKWKLKNEIKAELKAEQELEDVQSASRATSPAATHNASSGSAGSGNTYSSSTHTVSAGTSATPVPQKKGLSHTAKGAIVGAASGAVIGAVANKKNRVGGGAVGAVVGAATGAGVGIIVDKKEKGK